MQAGKLAVEAAAARLSEPAVGDLGFATLDLHRRERCGFPEVIFCEGKTPEWVEGVACRLADAKQDCLGTRVNAEQAQLQARQENVGPVELYQALPYVMTVVVLVLVSSSGARRRLGAPGALGVAYVREEL